VKDITEKIMSDRCAYMFVGCKALYFKCRVSIRVKNVASSVRTYTCAKQLFLPRRRKFRFFLKLKKYRQCVKICGRCLPSCFVVPVCVCVRGCVNNTVLGVLRAIR